LLTAKVERGEFLLVEMEGETVWKLLDDDVREKGRRRRRRRKTNADEISLIYALILVFTCSIDYHIQ